MLSKFMNKRKKSSDAKKTKAFRKGWYDFQRGASPFLDCPYKKYYSDEAMYWRIGWSFAFNEAHPAKNSGPKDS